MNDANYPGNRIAKQHPSGFLIIVPFDDSNVVPLACPLCSCLMRSQNDDVSFDEFGCCDRCAMTFAHPRREEWKDGWRPSSEAIAESVSIRQQLIATFS